MTITVDRNEAFAAERAAQITAIMGYNAAIPAKAEAAKQAADQLRGKTAERVASGELIPLGNDKYRVTQGWDRDEVWTMRVPFENARPMLLPESNLDESTGSAALYTRVPAWHALGTVVPEGVSDLDEVLRLGKIDFDVIQRAVRYAVDDDDVAAEMTRPEVKLMPGQFVNLRGDTMGPLGVVGKVYTPIQNREAGAFLQTLIETSGVVYESAGATYGGRHVFIGLRLPTNITIELADGVEDEIVPYLYWVNTHDGTGAARVTVSPWRIECGNTERFNLRDAVSTWKVRHTTNATSYIDEARKTLGLAGKHFTEFKREEEQLARVEMEIKAFRKLADEIYPAEKNASDRQKRQQGDRVDLLTAMFKGQVTETGQTAYSAERVFTDYMDHVAPRRVTGDRLAAARATALIEGSEDTYKAKVHEKLMLRVK